MLSIEAKAGLLGLAAALGLLGVTFGLSPLLQPATAAAAKEQSIKIASSAASPTLEGEAKRGQSLFDHNCAHCHGDDARGDEGPSLYDLKKSDARVTKIIKEGIKGEMPKFGTKFNDADIQALIAYVRTLKS
jgi:cbb3-type cytochrome c oxidase subunit III